MRRWIWIAIVVAIGLGAAVTFGDVRQLTARLDGFHWGAFAAALALALANYVIRFARWQFYLRRQDVHVPVGDSALVFGAGLSLSITPAKLGELVKSYLLRELHDVPATRTAPIVVAERVTDLLALLVLRGRGRRRLRDRPDPRRRVGDLRHRRPRLASPGRARPAP